MVDKAKRIEVLEPQREEGPQKAECNVDILERVDVLEHADVLEHVMPLVAPDGTVFLGDYLFTCFVLGIKPEGEPSSFETIFDFESGEYTQAVQNGDLEKLAESFQDAIVRLFAILNIDPALLSGEDAFDVYLEHMPVSWLAQLASDLHSPLNQTHKLRGRDPRRECVQQQHQA
jgi:hypothetical protein